MRRICEAAVILMMMGIAAGCGASRPIKYYMLDVAPAPAVVPSAQFPVNLLVARIATTHLYRDDRLVYGAGPVELGTYEYHRWAESPADMIQDMLISSLRSTGQYRSVSPIGSNLHGNYIVRGHLHALYEVDKPSIVGRFSVQIELFDPKTDATLWTDTYSHDEPVTGKTVPDVVAALDRNVRAGMQQLTTSIGQYFLSHPPQAPAAQ